MHTHQRFYLTHELMRGQVTGCSRFKDFREPRAGSEFKTGQSSAEAKRENCIQKGKFIQPAGLKPRGGQGEAGPMGGEHG